MLLNYVVFGAWPAAKARRLYPNHYGAKNFLRAVSFAVVRAMPDEHPSPVLVIEQINSDHFQMELATAKINNDHFQMELAIVTIDSEYFLWEFAIVKSDSD